MILGSGLIASAFRTAAFTDENIVIYAAGVSNSGCKNSEEFNRESVRLSEALARTPDALFVYFGTCSIYDPTMSDSPYVNHKLAMEELVSRHPNFLIVRLPQLAGKTENPYTLLNFFYDRISRGETVSIWKHSIRNIIDIDDVVEILKLVLHTTGFRNRVINIANPVNHPILKLVEIMENVTGKKAKRLDIVRGDEYSIDVSEINGVIKSLNINFDERYLERVIRKYYGTGK